MQFHFIKKILGVFSYYVAPMAMAGISFLSPDSDFFILLGKGALTLLAIILFVKPLAVILKNNFLWTTVSLRRELGILVFWLFFFHAGGLIYAYNLYQPAVRRNLSIGFYFGLIAGLGLLLLALTANNFAIKLLKRNWKRLHYLTYFVFLFALLHKAVFTGKYFFLLSLFFIFTVLKIIEFRKLNKLNKKID